MSFMLSTLLSIIHRSKTWMQGCAFTVAISFLETLGMREDMRASKFSAENIACSKKDIATVKFGNYYTF